MTSALIVFVDLGGVIIDKDQQITQWQGLVGECFVRLLGGTQEAWTLAHRLVTNHLEKWGEAYGQTPADFLSFYRSYQLQWVTGMCELLGILTPAEEECLGLAYRAIASITRCIQAGCPLCQRRSARIHSRYVRQVADLPGWAARFAWNYICAAFSVPTWSVPAVSSRNGCRVRWLPTPGARHGSRMS